MTDTVNSREIEERVVAMRFDNAQFEKGTKQTLGTLEKLKSSLNFSGAAKGFKTIASDTNLVTKNIAVLNQGVNSIKSEFDSLSVIGATCLVNLTNAAIKAGKNIVNALALEPVTTGLQEYETKIGSIQTILTNTSSKGTTIEEVTKALDDLNVYADKTIYNFTEMTKNIGRFTAAGVELQTATDAIQGIANLAAASGSTSQQASTAMYQLSQALSAGSLKLQDWNSVVNAGMGGTMFQEALKETARELGRGDILDDALKKYGSFRETLQAGWIDAKVLTTTLNKFTTQGAKAYGEQMQKNGKYTEEQNKKLQEQASMMESAATEVKTFTALWDTLKETAQSGWTQTWELIIGDYETAKDLFTKLNNTISPIIDKMSQARNDFVEKVMGSPSKWEDIVKKFEKAGIGLETINKGMQETFIRRGIVRNTEEYNKLLEEAGGDYSKLLKNSGMTWVGIREGLLDTIKNTKEYDVTTMSATEKLKKFQEVVNDVWAGDYGNQDWNSTRQKALEKEGYEYERIQRLVNLVTEAKSGEALVMEDLTAEDLRSLGLTEKEVEAYEKLQKEIRDTNSTLTEWIKTVNKATGRELLIDSLFNIGEAIKGVVKQIKDAYDEVFGKFTTEDAYGLIEKFNKFTKSLILNEQAAKNVKNAFISLFNAIEIVRYVMSTGFRLALQMVQSFLKGMGLDISGLLQGLADGTTSLREFIKSIDAVPLIMEHIGPTIEKLGGFVAKVIDLIKNPEGFNGVTDSIVKCLEKLADNAPPLISKLITKIASLFNKEFAAKIGASINLENIGDTIKKAYEKAKTTSVTELITEAMLNAEDSGDTDEARESLLDKIINRIKNFFIKVFEKLKEIYTKVKEYVKINLDPGTILSAVMIMSISKFGQAIADLISGFDDPLKALTAMFRSISGTFGQIKTYIKNINARQTSRNFLTISLGILAIAFAIKQIADLKVGQILVAGGVLAAIGVIVALMASVMTSSAKLKAGESTSIMPFLNAIAIIGAMLAMCKAIKDLAQIEYEDLTKAVGVMTQIFAMYAVLALVMTAGSIAMMGNTVGDPKTGGAIGIALIGVGVAMLIMANVLKTAGSVDDTTMTRALKFVTIAGIVLSLLALALATTIKKGASSLNALTSGAAIIAMTIALGLMVGVVKEASKVTTSEVESAMAVLTRMGFLMAALMVLSNLSFKSSTGLSVVAMAFAMTLLVPLIKSINKLSDEEVSQAMGVMWKMVGLMAVLSILSKDWNVSNQGSVGTSGKHGGAVGLMLIEMAIAMTVLTGVIAIIGSMSEEKVKRGVGAVSAILGMMAVLIAATKLSGDVNFVGLSSVLITVSALVVALSVLTPEKLEQGILAAAAIGVIISIMIASTALSKDAKWGPIVAMLAGFAVIVLMLAVVIANINDAVNGGNADAVIGSVTAAAIMIVACGAALALMSHAMARKVKLPSMLASGGMLIALMLVMSFVAYIIDNIAGSKSHTSEMTGEKFGQIAGSLVLAALILIVCAAAMAIISKYVMPNLDGTKDTWKKLGQAGAMIGGLLLAVTFASLIVRLVSGLDIKADGETWHKLGMTMAVTAAILLLAAGMTFLISKIQVSSGGDMAKVGVAAAGVLAIAVLAAAFLDNIMALSTFDTSGDMWKKLGMVGTVTFAILALGFVCGLAAQLLAKVKMGEVGVFATTIAIVTAVASMIAIYIMPALSWFSNSNGIIEKAAALCIILAAIAAVSAFLGIVQNTVFSKIDTGKIGNLIAEGGTLIVVAAVANSIANDVMPALNKVEGDGILDKCLGLSAILVGLAIACLILGAIGAIPGGKLAMATGAAVIVAMVAAFAMIAEKVAKDFLDDIAPKLPEAGQQMEDFSAHMKTFGENIKTIDSSKVDAVKKIVDMMLDLPALIEGFDQLDYADRGRKDDGDWMSDTKDRLVKIADICVAFSNALENGKLSKEAIDNAVHVVDMYETIWKLLPAVKGKEGENIKNFNQFGDDLNTFADHIITFSDKLKTVASKLKKEEVDAFVAITTPLINLQKDLYGAGGTWQKFFGEKSFGGFGSDLEVFVNTMARIYGVISGKAMYDERGFKLSSSSADWTDTKWQAFADTASLLITTMSLIPASGGLLGLIVGNQDFNKFSTALPLFASGVQECYKAISIEDWDLSIAQKFKDAIKPIADGIKDAVPYEGGWISALSGRGKQEWEKFGKGLQELGKGMGIFSKAIYDDTDMFKDAKAVGVIQHFKEAMQEMPTEGEWQEIIEAFDLIATWDTTEDWTGLGNIISKIAGSLDESDVNKTLTASSSLQLLVSALDQTSGVNFSSVEKFADSIGLLGQNTVSGFISQFDNAYSRVDESVGGFLNATVKHFDSFNSKLGILSWEFKRNAQAFLDEIQKKGTATANNILSFLTTLTNNMRGKYDAFFQCGQYLVEGFIMGMRDRENDVRWEVNAAGDMVITLFRKKLDERSPSHVMEQIGEYVGIGLANGIYNSITNVHDAALAMADTTNFTLSDMVTQTLAAFDDTNVNPTVTPVLDLSEVQNGTGLLDGMFGGYSVSLARNIATINRGATNEDVINTLNGLNDTLSGISGDTYNVNGITYDDGSNVASAVSQLIYAANIARRN